MERDFRYLRDKYGDGGAREIFEKICIELFQTRYENVHAVKASPGDDGIDVLVGDINKPTMVFQCKFFIEGINASQISQIKESFDKVINNHEVKEWLLCIPNSFTVKNHQWWSEWKTIKQQETGIKIDYYDGYKLIYLLQEANIYDRVFDEDVRNSLDTIKKYLQEENNRIYNEILYDLEENPETSYDDCIFIKMLESANIKELDTYKNDFFNAEISKQKILSKGQEVELKIYKQLLKKIKSVWGTQYRVYKDKEDGNELLNKTYIRVEDLDTTTLASIDDISLLAKKGMLHQLAEDQQIGWIENYIEKLEEYIREEQHGDDSQKY